MKRILFVVESLSGGGAEKVLTTIVKNIDRSKFDITVLTVVNTGVYLDELKPFCKLKYMLKDSRQIKGLTRKVKYRLDYKWIYTQSVEKVYKKYITEKYDVEIAFVEGFATKLIAASTNKNSKKICWLHIDMDKNPYADNYYSSLEEERTVYCKYDYIIGVSESVKLSFERKFSLPGSVRVIYNPIDKDEIEYKSKQEDIKKPNELCIISIGRLEKQKGYDRIITALSELKNYRFSYTFWILGDGTEKNNLETMIRDYGLENEVHLLGFKKNPYCWLVASDVFVCCSRAEGYSLVIAEAMLLGKPILSLDCSGPNELLNFGDFGVLVPNTDEDLKEMMRRLLNGEIDLHKYSELSIKRQDFFELSNVINQIEGLL